MNDLNIFNKYENKMGHNEDYLTHAFFCLLSYSKISQVQLIKYINDELQNQKIDINIDLLNSKAEVKQITIQTSTTNLFKIFEGTVLSVLLTDEGIDAGEFNDKSERYGIIDGIIEIEDNSNDSNLMIIIENKPKNSNVWYDQLSFQNTNNITVIRKIVTLEWKKIIQILGNLIQKEIVSFCEKKLINDFFLYIDTNFSFLNPYDKYSLCKNNMFLLNKHSQKIMEELSIGEVTYHYGWLNTIKVNRPQLKEIAIKPVITADGNKFELILEVYPGGTMNQARNLYSAIMVDKIIALIESGFKIEPNFHFALMQRNTCWTSTKLTIEEYIYFWKKLIESNKFSQLQRINNKFDLNFLLENNIMTQSDYENSFKNEVESKHYQVVNLCPEIGFTYTWSQETIIQLEEKNILISDIKSKINLILNCWNDKL